MDPLFNTLGALVDSMLWRCSDPICRTYLVLLGPGVLSRPPRSKTEVSCLTTVPSDSLPRRKHGLALKLGLFVCVPWFFPFAAMLTLYPAVLPNEAASPGVNFAVETHYLVVGRVGFLLYRPIGS